ncbi:MAG: hypothetical protein BAJALOKI1v1_1930002 [Promethearchaeota archaeon]|nr:MAG: hypothetical protein BAJALOKI1v1_1930002 [Candidatus Lokiarchaeota archaeon]
MKHNLTRGGIYPLEEIENTILLKDLFLDYYNREEKVEDVLIIHSTSLKCIKVHIYPLRAPYQIYKITIIIEKIHQETLAQIITVLKDTEVIHSSGFFGSDRKDQKGEFYINLQFMKIEALVKKLKQISHSISIEKIGD